MQKDFLNWHSLKSKIEDEHIAPLFREQEIWWCSLGANVGVEEDGKNEFFERPVLILRKFNKEMLWALPMTSQKKESHFYHTFPFKGFERTAMLSQLRVLSGKRLIRRIGKLSDNQFLLAKEAVGVLLKRDGPLSGASSA